jgi:hypothetical protein
VRGEIERVKRVRGKCVMTFLRRDRSVERDNTVDVDLPRRKPSQRQGNHCDEVSWRAVTTVY